MADTRSTIKVPRQAIHLTEFAEYYHYLEAFANGIYKFIILLGRPGIGKSYATEDTLKQKHGDNFIHTAHKLRGWILYKRLWHQLHLVLDPLQ